jgi:hypothetical protein
MGFKLLRPGLLQNLFQTSNFLGFSQSSKYNISGNGCEHFDSPTLAEKISGLVIIKTVKDQEWIVEGNQ